MKKIVLLAAIVAALVVTAVALAETQVLLGTTQTSWPVQGEFTPGYQNVYAWQFTAPVSKSTATASFYFASHHSTEVVGIYSDASGVPGTLLGSVSLGSSGTAWKVASLGVALTSGTSYWIAEDQTGNTGANTYPIDSNFDFTGCADQVNADRELSGQASLPATWPSVSNVDNYCPHGFVFKG